MSVSPPDQCTIEVPVDADKIVYIFTGARPDVHNAIRVWQETGAQTYQNTRAITDEVMTSTLTAPQRRPSPAQSPEYKAALAAQIDFDSTQTGLDLLDQQLRATASPEYARGLLARKVAGEHARTFRREQVTMMPPVVRRGQPGYREYNTLAETRERLARDLACAAAETNAWTKPSPATTAQVLARYDEALIAERAAGVATVLWRHPRLLGAGSSSDRAPWLGKNFDRPVTVGDVMIVLALGMTDATWRDGKVYATGSPDGVFRWGYTARMDGVVSVITTAPDLHAWYKAVTAAR